MTQRRHYRRLASERQELNLAASFFSVAVGPDEKQALDDYLPWTASDYRHELLGQPPLQPEPERSSCTSDARQHQ